jgi:Xaa-Pro aminopeptidase
MNAKMPYGWGRVPFDYEARKKWMDLPFSVEEYESRVERLREKMREHGFDALIVYGTRGDRGPIRYLTNFEDYYKGDSLFVIPLEGGVAFTTNSVFHGEPMHSGIQNVWMEDVRAAAHPRTAAKAASVFDHLADMLNERGLGGGKLALSGEVAAALKEPMRAVLPKAELLDAGKMVAQSMTIKSPAEVQVLKESALILDEALKAAMENAREGITEYELSGLAMGALFRHGAEGGNFPMALSSGPRAGFKHVPPTERTLQKGEWVFADLGGVYKGYTSDASRQTVVGGPSNAQRNFMEAQIAIVEAVLAEAKAGVRICDLAKLGIEVAREAGVEDNLYFRGHGISTFSHVPPSINPTNEAVLEEDMVFCFEPMLIKYEFGTACVENMYHVTQDDLVCLNECPWRWWE